MAESDAMNVLALNSGSSSLKFGLYHVGPSGAETRVAGAAESIGRDGGGFRAHDGQGRTLVSETAAFASQGEAIARIGAFLAETGGPTPDAVGHRVVHGGPKLRQHRLIDDALLRELEDATPFAPLHVPAALAVIRFAEAHFPGIPHAACFDTTFHADLPEVARTLPIPGPLRSQGVQRYGFHGLSCESIVRQFAGEVPDRMIIAHLGNGASVTAVEGGRSVDTSMGLTPTGGLIMGTRSGDLDPGVLVYLVREKGFDAAELEALVDQRSGLLGISGLASDMRRLREAAASNADARLAIAMFCYSVRKAIAAMTAALGGLDTLVFTGGIGENDPEARAAICAGLSFLGVALDEARNRAGDDRISAPAARVAVRVLPAREDEVIAGHTRDLVASVA